jgi:hypothetical protein
MNAQQQRSIGPDQLFPRVIAILPALLLAVIAPAYALQDKKPAGLIAAREAYERFKKLEGKWKGKSTKGWDENH